MLLELLHPSLRLGLVRASGLRCAPSSPQLQAELQGAEAALRAEPSRYPEQVRAAVRDVLRVGGYKPTGRGKPASELLLALALAEGLPRISNLVDINNLASLESALPMSMFDAELLGSDVAVRFGRAGERYVFNASGQSIELEGLPVVCRGVEREPVGNAVRDSMVCKVNSATRQVVAVVYGTALLPAPTLLSACERLASLLRTHAGATHVQIDYVP
jgi:DNA/RNA-binding domain of Phe-tRNA-synthetase-like protein